MSMHNKADPMKNDLYRSHDFIDIFSDVFTAPEDLVMYNLEYSHDARRNDACRIGRDMNKAIADLDLL